MKKSTVAEIKLRSYVDFVKSILADSQCPVPFYIMGGSVYSTLKGLDEFSDIDVFFSNLEDAEDAIAAVNDKIIAIDKLNKDDLFTLSMGLFLSANALSFNWIKSTEFTTINTNKKIQLIRKKVGTVHEIFNTFDLNTSQCCITSNYEVISNVMLNEDIKINFKEFKSNTIQRYSRYILEKKCTDKGNSQLFKSIDYLIDNFFIKMDDALYDNIDTKGYELIFGTLCNYYADSLEVRKYIFNEMCKKFKKDELIQAFTNLNFNFGAGRIAERECALNNTCIEYNVYMLTVLKSKLITQDSIKLAHEHYPEYFL